MSRFLLDAFNLACFRGQPLAHYTYPAWQPMLWLTLLGAVDGMTATGFNAEWTVRLLFFIALNWAEVIVLSLFMVRWLGLAQQPGVSLFPLLALAQSPQLLQGLLDAAFGGAADAAPTSVQMGLGWLLAVYSILVIVRALGDATGASRGRTLLGVVLFLPVALTMLLLSGLLAAKLGWIAPPPELIPGGGGL